ncbi:MAG: hypothetical protein ACLQVJ_29275 [Syntrophobacteraceae bacterium]
MKAEHKRERTAYDEVRRRTDYPTEPLGTTKKEADAYAEMLDRRLPGSTITHALVSLETMKLTGLQLRAEDGKPMTLTFENPSRMGHDPLLFENENPRIVSEDEISPDHQSMEGWKITYVCKRVTHFTDCKVVHGIMLEQGSSASEKSTSPEGGTQRMALFFKDPTLSEQ